MASIRKRGNSYTITAYMGYDEQGRQRKKTTTFTPPDGVTPGKAEKLAKAYAATWKEKIKGYVALDENRTLSELAEWYYSTVAPSVLKPKTLLGYKKTVYDHVISKIGREKLKNITPPMLDSLFAELQRNGCMQGSFRLKDRSLLDGVNRENLAKKAGVTRSAIYDVLAGQTVRRENAEKIAAGLEMPFNKVFDDVTKNQGLSGASVNKIKLNLSAIFMAAVKKEIMRRNPCKLATPPKVDTKPSAYFDEEQCRKFLAALHEQPDIHLHSLRHTHASLLINSNVTAKVIADRLGHSTTKTTLDTYSHVFAESEVKAMQAIDMALFRKAE